MYGYGSFSSQAVLGLVGSGSWSKEVKTEKLKISLVGQATSETQKVQGPNIKPP